MMTNLFQMKVPVEVQSRFDEVGSYNLTVSLERESGTQLMLVMRSLENPGEYWILEQYQDEESYQIHQNSPQFNYFVQEGAPLVTERRKIEVKPVAQFQRFNTRQFQQGAVCFKQVTVEDAKLEFEETYVETMKQAFEQNEQLLAIYFLKETEGSPTYYYLQVSAAPTVAYLDVQLQGVTAEEKPLVIVNGIAQ